MDLQKSKLIVIIPIVVSVLAATFGSVKYIINLTETIEENKTQVISQSSSPNQWDWTGSGNYWSDYIGSDANNNGIGDMPYQINT